MINEMVELLRSEFVQDVPATEQTLVQWQKTPLEPPLGVADMLSLVDRFTDAVESVGFQGLAAFLGLVRSVIVQAVTPGFDGQANAANEEAAIETELAVVWLEQWTDEIVAYLENPAHPLIVEHMSAYMSLCPKSIPEELALEIAALLLVLPQDSSHEGDDADVLEPAMAQDVVLSTEHVDPELLHAMLADAPQQLQVLEDAVRRWGEGKCSSAEMLEAQRSAHTFKGSGNIIGLPGIGKVAHRLEDVLEFAVEGLSAAEPPSTAMVRDVTQAVYCLHQMVGYLQGEETAPSNSQAVLQRLLDWVGWIRQGEAAMADPEPLAGPIDDAGDVGLAGSLVDSEKGGDAAAGPDAGRAREAGALRVNSTQLSRMLRRAGQSVIHAERLSRILLDTDGWLAEMERNNQVLAHRLRELDVMVNSQVVQLREAQGEGSNFDPLELDRYDALHGLSRFISESARDTAELVKQARTLTGQSSAIMREESYALVDQHRELLTVRMVLVKSIVPRLRRIVAQTAGTTGRRVELKISGEDVAMDADVLNRLTEPLLHLLRNAVDHGIETPQDRAYAGKPETGTIQLSFRRLGDEVQLLIADDGRGLDVVAIEAKALRYGVINENGNLSEAELYRLILQPGFSTRDAVTETSGRGVGMDIVNDRITGLKGRLDIESTYGQGSCFTLHVPVTSGVALALIVECAGESVALPQDQILSIAAAGLADFQQDGDQISIRIDDVAYPAFALANWLDFDALTSEMIMERASQWIAILAKGASGSIALLVDAAHASRELILQDVGRLTRRVPGIVGGALRPDGRSLFLVGVQELERAANRNLHLGISKVLRKRLEIERTLVLVVDDAWSVRRSMQQLLEDSGYEVATAGDGFEALDSLRARKPAIVITDLEMPNLNGLELTRRIREVPDWSDLPVVMITSRTSDKHRAMATDAGVNVYLTKPYQDIDLLEKVRSLAAHATRELDLAF